MEFPDVLDKQVSHFLISETFLFGGKEVCFFGEAIHDYQDSVIPTTCLGKLDDKII